jgi:hypothetical protein
MRKPATFFAVVIFALVAIAHLLRLIFGVPVMVAGWPIPSWISVFGFVVPGALSVALWRERVNK